MRSIMKQLSHNPLKVKKTGKMNTRSKKLVSM